MKVVTRKESSKQASEKDDSEEDFIRTPESKRSCVSEAGAPRKGLQSASIEAS